MEAYSKEELAATKGLPLAADLVKYICEHPGERFWQALRNWSEASEIIHCRNGKQEDTFYWENNRKF